MCRESLMPFLNGTHGWQCIDSNMSHAKKKKQKRQHFFNHRPVEPAGTNKLQNPKIQSVKLATWVPWVKNPTSTCSYRFQVATKHVTFTHHHATFAGQQVQKHPGPQLENQPPKPPKVSRLNLQNKKKMLRLERGL